MNPDKTQTPENTNDGVGRLNKLAYRDGYLYNRADEPDISPQNYIIRENKSATKGLLLGMSVTVLAGILGGTIFLVTHAIHHSKTPLETSPVPPTNQPQK